MSEYIPIIYNHVESCNSRDFGNVEIARVKEMLESLVENKAMLCIAV